ncbi:sugar phosphate isomerase/epimerase family protein [Saccharothrix sp. HUAS TT1]|uniref:sugar phosphate isomerase/epimerase family protein n=1 Tax=unclassified Saccharothrix TaxID=2593673 RepID=UPI00345B7117
MTGLMADMPQWKIACQEHLLPGASVQEKWEFARLAGFDGIELRAPGGEAFGARLGDLDRAVGRGVVVPSVCLDVLPLVGDVDRRVDIIGQVSERMGVIAALGGRVVVLPVTDGHAAAPSVEDYRVPLDDLRRLAERAEGEGVSLCVQPVNRYEGRPVNTLDQAVELCRVIGLPSLRVAAHTFHMNVEEVDPPGALLAAGPWLGHVELADSTGLEPGAGHVDWWAAFAALDAAGHRGWVSLACDLSGPAESVLPAAVSLLRQAGG